MCGIAGSLQLNHSPDLAKLQEHSRCFSSRGPDNYGAKVFENLGLCHRRLSIIDLDERSHQPMEKSGLAIVFNGEIYNFVELKRELIRSGISFTTTSDTETILAAYECWGIAETVNRLDGMFAFGLLDRQRSKLFLVRDIYGQKPLYWYKDSKQLLFSSDIRFISGQASGLTIDHDSLDFYFQELSMPQPKTIWNEISQIEPGYYYEIDVNNLNIVEHQYYQFDFDCSRNKFEWPEAVEMVETELKNAVLKRMVSDVPVACFLSGGVDSGLIVSLLAQNSSEKVNTFSVGFKEEEFNELPYAKSMAEKYGTNHIELLIEPNIQEDIHAILADIGEPFGDSSLIPSYLVTKEMSEHYKVALSGDGGDELFGYPNYADFFELEQFFNSVPSSYRKLKIAGSKVLSRFGVGKNLGRFSPYLNDDPSGEYLKRGMVFENAELNRLFNSRKSEYGKEYLDMAWNYSNASTISNKVIAGSLRSRLLNDYLVKVDRASMMNALEVRSPFLDKQLGEVAFRIPNSLKFRNGKPKSILKELAKKYIDPDIEQRKKSGFGIPINHWLRNELNPLVLEVLSEKNFEKHGLFNWSFVNSVVREHMSGQLDHRHILWCLLSFQVWYNKYA